MLNKLDNIKFQLQKLDTKYDNNNVQVASKQESD